MAQCTAGSRARGAAPAFFWFTWSAFIAWLALRFARFGTIVWAFFGDSPFDVSVFCATEPVIPSVPTTAQWLGFFTFDFAARVAVEQYLIASFKASLWPTYCECIPSGGTYSCTSLLTHPRSYSNSTAVSDGEWGVEFVPSVNLTIYGGWQRVGAVGTGQFKHCVYGPGVGTGGVYCEIITPTAGDVKYFFVNPVPAVAGSTYKYTGKFPAGSGWALTYDGVNATPTTIAGTTYNSMVGRTGTDPFTVQSPFTFPPDPLFCPAIDAYYPPLPTDPAAIPDHPEVSCSTTADLCNRVSAVLSSILETNRNVSWLQSSTAPICWVPGTASTGLTGAGTFAVVDVVGFYVTLAYPAGWGKTADVPARLIPKVGELHPLVDGVQVDERQLHYAAEQLLGVPISTNGVGYSLRPGVTASITPLQRCK